MTTNNTTPEAGKFENIKKLNSLNQQGSEISVLLNNIKDMHRRLDSVLFEQRERERTLDKQKRDEQRRVEEEAEQSKPVKEEKPKEPALEIKEKEREREKEAAAAVKLAEAPKPVVKAAPEPAAPAKEDVTRSKQFSATPSYIRGKFSPAPPVAPQIRRPAQTPGTRPPYTPGQNRPAGAPRPFGDRAPGSGFAPRSPQGGGMGFKRPGIVKKAELPVVAPTKERKVFDKKKEFSKGADDKKSMNKRTLIRKGFIQENTDEERANVRKLKNKKKEQPAFIAQKVEKAIITTENLTVKILSEKIGKTAQEIIKQLMLLNIMTNINSVVDFPTMELVANELGVELELRVEKTQEEKLEADHDITDADEVLVKRPPIITVMGHVNHGKTSLLDAIKKTNIASGEAGGITQHIGAYSVICKGEKITFLDTPGHEAFAEMRARGAKVTDIAILVVAADDGIMPQTIEAVNHAKSANVPVILAVNKIDKAGANIDKIKQAITEYGLVPEDWGGDTMIVPLSAKTGEGIDKLLESILLLAEVNAYRANPSRKAKGSVIEAKLDKGKGPVANIIVQNGTLNVGDIVVSGTAIGKVRAMTDDKGRSIKEAPPSTPVSVLGLTEVPNAGDIIMVVSDEKSAKQVVAERMAKIKNDQMVSNQKTTLDDVFNKIQEGKIKDLNVIIKADVQGSVEALKNSLAKITNEEARVNIVAGSVGAINKSDIMIAEVSKSIIIGFNVRPDAETKTLAESAGIEICMYKVIYEAIEELERRLSGMIAPKTKEVITGRAQVRNVFKITGAGIIAGSYVTNGKIYRGSHARIYRGGELVFNGQINGLKRFKDDVKEVAENYECGISIDNFSDIKELDEIEAYTIEIVK